MSTRTVRGPTRRRNFRGRFPRSNVQKVRDDLGVLNGRTSVMKKRNKNLKDVDPVGLRAGDDGITTRTTTEFVVLPFAGFGSE